MPNEILNNMKSLFAAWHGAGVCYCHWKSNEHLYEGLIGKTDLDLLIDPAHLARATALLCEHGFKRVISHPWKNYSGVEDWLGMDNETGTQTHLHVHYRLLTGLSNVKEQYLRWERIVLQTCILHNEYQLYVALPEVEMVMLLSRIALKISRLGALCCKSVLNDDNNAEYQYLLRLCETERVQSFVRQMLPGKAACAYTDWFGDISNKKKFLLFQQTIVSGLRDTRRLPRFIATVLYQLRFCIFKASRLLKRPIRLKKRVASGGKLISFLGVDGAGKTTLATYAAKWLSWKMDCRYVYLGTGDGKSSLLNRMGKGLARRMAGKKHASSSPQMQPQSTDTTSNDPHTLSLKSQIKTCLRNAICYANARYRQKTILRIYRMVCRGTIVITDRYPQIQAPFIYDGPSARAFVGKGSFAWLNNFFVQKEGAIYRKIAGMHPDHVIKLFIPVEVSCARKPCTPAEKVVITKKVELTETLSFGSAVTHRIDSSGELERTKTQVRQLLWEII